jgi:hydrogenase maturation protein HypF
MIERTAFELSGQVQGVGYRPFVYSLATTLGLNGFVQNAGGRLLVDVEGDLDALRLFERRLVSERPLHARVDRIENRRLPPVRHQRFVIADSDVTIDGVPDIPPDAATCDACVAELFDPRNRRHRHAFIACATCGPRYSIITTLPFDRGNTTMAGFPMCIACRREYDDPRDRRFHAQTLSCPSCGPLLEARADGRALAWGDEALRAIAKVLVEGGVAAVKGIGGFHLACDATNAGAIAALRQRKGREAKPLAVMLPMSEAARLSRCAPAATGALASPERAIVLVERALVQHAGIRLAAGAAPACAAIGVFLPYSPVHHLLLQDVGRPLVMTSGNLSDEPMACTNADALERLTGIADAVLLHDREIARRCDDGVVRMAGEDVTAVRRGRGRSPASLPLAEAAPRTILALGADLKNAFCFMRGERAYVSPHVGSLDSLEARQALARAVVDLGAVLRLTPEVVVHDRHPDLYTSALAHAYDGIPRLDVQHHHAHVLSCVAEHRCTEPVIGVAFDGSGLGHDGAVWGGEFLLAEGCDAERAAHFAYVPLPGGDAAAREPWRMAVSHLDHAYGPGLDPIVESIVRRIGAIRVQFIRQMIAHGTSSPQTSSVGRLFDAVASLLGLRDVVRFEGQAAMALEAVATGAHDRRYEFALDTSQMPWRIDPAPAIRAIADDWRANRPAGVIAAAFHEALAAAIADTATQLSRRTAIRRVVLTGGVFQNARLSSLAAGRLTDAGLEVLAHRQVPCNDGGVSLGQALFAARRLRADERAGGGVVRCA